MLKIDICALYSTVFMQMYMDFFCFVRKCMQKFRFPIQKYAFSLKISALLYFHALFLLPLPLSLREECGLTHAVCRLPRKASAFHVRRVDIRSLHAA